VTEVFRIFDLQNTGDKKIDKKGAVLVKYMRKKLCESRNWGLDKWA